MRPGRHSSHSCSIKLEQKSGALTTWRGEGGTLEEGTVVFAGGQMTRAAVGRRSGITAFNYLCTWGYCRYTFHSSAPEEARPVNTPQAYSTEQLPAARDAFSEAQHPRAPGTNPTGGRQMFFPVALPPRPYEESNGNVAREGSGGNGIVPRSTRPLHDVLLLIDRYRLSRTHRQLFLLIDGQRSLVELMFLMRRNVYEIRRLLRDLEHLGVIEIGGK